MKTLLFALVFASSLFSQTILCYKNNIKNDTIAQNIQLDGQECKGTFTVNDMKNAGWELDDSKIIQNSSSTYNHVYILKKETKTSFKIDSKPMHIAKLDLDMSQFTLSNVAKNKATINKGDLIVGQSGIVIHKYQDNNSIIISNAMVVATTNDSSTIRLTQNQLLKQKALPSSSLKVQNGDIFILNHLYSSSLLLVPNFEASQKIQNIYPEQNFINADIFAAYLKVNNKPIPSQKDIQDFCKSQDIGTIYISAENNFYILDTQSFEILKTTPLYITDKSTQTPFFTKVDDIKKSFWTFWNFKSDKILDYNNYYLSLINNTTYTPDTTTSVYDNGNEEETQKESSILKTIKGWLPW